MKKLIYIFSCGFLGAYLRSIVYKLDFLNVNMPYNTLTVNLIGAFLLSFVLFLTLKEIKLGEELHTGITTGFLGAFTTFSTLSKDMFNMIETGHIINALIYISISLIGGYICVYLGYCLVR